MPEKEPQMKKIAQDWVNWEASSSISNSLLLSQAIRNSYLEIVVGCAIFTKPQPARPVPTVDFLIKYREHTTSRLFVGLSVSVCNSCLSERRIVLEPAESRGGVYGRRLNPFQNTP